MNEMNQFSDPNPIDLNTLLGENRESPVEPSSQPELAQNIVPTSQTFAPQPQKPYLWFALWFLVSCSLGGLSAFGFLLLTALPPATDCQNISSISPDIERLQCAQDAARSGELPQLLAGVELVETWTTDHPLYNEANRWMAEWSSSILQIARQRMAQNDLDGALELANRIPDSSPIYAEVQETIAQWQTRWQAGEAIYNQAQEALKQQDWDLAYAKIFDLREHPYSYWSGQQANALSEQVLAEKQARRLLAEAISIAQIERPQQLKAAFERLQPIDRQTHTWAEAQSTLNDWGEVLLQAGYQHWQDQQFQEARSLAELAKLSDFMAPEAENLNKLSQARELAIASGSGWKVGPQHIWRMMEAIAAAQKIPPESRFYDPAQFSLASWQAQLQDMRQLQAAQILASLGNRDAVEMAIEQATQIDSSRPRRLQAQTLIAHWRVEAERLEDQPILQYAQRTAEAGTLQALQAAITQVKQIPLGRVLYGEAQGLSYEWSRKVEVLEDEPFLQMAQSHARQGRLTEAIQAASTIRPERALYRKAQTAIADWQAQLNPDESPRSRPSRTVTAQEDTEDEVRSTAANSDRAIEAEVEPNPLPDSFSMPSPQPIASPPHHLPRTIDELMQTHPRPADERLPASQIRPTRSNGVTEERRNQPSATEVIPAAPIPPAPTVIQSPEWSSSPVPEVLAEPSSSPDAGLEAAPVSPAPAAPVAPIFPLPTEEYGQDAIDPLPAFSEPVPNDAPNEPASVPGEEAIPLSEERLEYEPLSLNPGF
ncbi:hypothetical protein [Egbenema bharatensis]|uniref:hypothetical protein n=1 Tax=Egbenema bharatensis TaxID=3463334 RepID=UPI003A8498DB